MPLEICCTQTPYIYIYVSFQVLSKILQVLCTCQNSKAVLRTRIHIKLCLLNAHIIKCDEQVLSLTNYFAFSCARKENWREVKKYFLL